MIFNYFRKKRLFLNKKEMKAFINSSVNRGAVIRQCEAIRRHISDDDVRLREKCLIRYHFIPPKTAQECTQMIEDIQKVVF